MSIERTGGPSPSIPPTQKISTGIEEQLEAYVLKEHVAMKEWLQERGVTFEHHFTAQQYEAAEDLGAGVSGAKKIFHNGKTYILKVPMMTQTFRKNFISSVENSKPIEHQNISESDNPFTHFPRKEKVGSQLCHHFGVSSPKTELVWIEGVGYGSLQEFIPEDQATVMNKKGFTVPAAEIELESMVKVFLWSLVTENVDLHSGNILLLYLPPSSDDDDELQIAATYKMMPIDYGLLFSRSDSIYPQEFKLLLKALYVLLASKNIDFNFYVSSIANPTAILQDPILNQLMTDEEKKTFTKNLKALKLAADKTEGKMTTEAFLQLFLSVRQTMGRAS